MMESYQFLYCLTVDGCWVGSDDGAVVPLTEVGLVWSVLAALELGLVLGTPVSPPPRPVAGWWMDCGDVVVCGDATVVVPVTWSPWGCDWAAAAVFMLLGISLVPVRLAGEVGRDEVVPEQMPAMMLCHWAASDDV